MRLLRRLVPIAVLLGAIPWLSPTTMGARPPAARALTFFVAGDSHFGARNVDALNRSIVEQLNALPGTDYPPAIGGRVELPRGLLFMGDMTDSSLEEEWRQFEELYGLTGRDGLLKWPVYEAIGNHDFIGDSPVRGHVERRHGSLIYSWDWDGVHFVCLDMHPDAKNLKWLAQDLKTAGERPLVVFFHYALDGPYSDFWEEEQKAAFGRAIEGRNVLAIFHGHFHRAGHYTWRGHDVFLPGSPRHSSHAFLVVRLGRDRLDVAFWDFSARRWTETFTKRIRR
jgi:cytolysin (calcineurin-like family phosphatase)